MQWRNIFGWAAVALTTIFACFWGFWGSIENFHEGWYFSSFWMNVGLMFIQYLLFALLLMALGSVSIFFPGLALLCISRQKLPSRTSSSERPPRR